MSTPTHMKYSNIPPFCPSSNDYYVEVNGQRLDVWPVTVSSKPTNELYRGTQRDKSETEQASMVSFDFEGAVNVRIVCAWEIFYARVLPLSKGIVPKRGSKNKGDEVSFEISQPGQYILEINGLHMPLHIFANPKEESVPDPDALNVQSFIPDEKLNFPGNFGGAPKLIPDGKDTIYFGPGVHMPYIIELKSNQSLYIDAGAIVYGTILVENAENVHIYGRGILSGARFDRQNHRNGLIYTILIAHSKNVTVEGITILDSVIYNLSIAGGSNINVDNVKIFSWRRNSDGIDIHNTSYVTIKNSFIRAFDDSIVIKGQRTFSKYSTNHAPTAHILVEKCTIWGDWGRGVEFGAETSADEMRDVIIRDTDIVHFAFVACDIQACGDAPISDILFENIRVGDPIDPLIHPRLIEIFIRNMLWLKGESLGSVRKIKYRNISYDGLVICPCRFIGQSSEHNISDIWLENITLNGRLLESENDLISPLIVNEFTDNIYINGKKCDRNLCRIETEEDTCNSYLVGNGAFIVI